VMVIKSSDAFDYVIKKCEQEIKEINQKYEK